MSYVTRPKRPPGSGGDCLAAGVKLRVLHPKALIATHTSAQDRTIPSGCRALLAVRDPYGLLLRYRSEDQARNEDTALSHLTSRSTIGTFSTANPTLMPASATRPDATLEVHLHPARSRVGSEGWDIPSVVPASGLRQPQETTEPVRRPSRWACRAVGSVRPPSSGRRGGEAQSMRCARRIRTSSRRRCPHRLRALRSGHSRDRTRDRTSRS